MPEIVKYILIFFAGDIIGVCLAAFMIATSKNNAWLDFWQGYVEGYSKAKEDIKNDCSSNGTPSTKA